MFASPTTNSSSAPTFAVNTTTSSSGFKFGSGLFGQGSTFGSPGNTSTSAPTQSIFGVNSQPNSSFTAITPASSNAQSNVFGATSSFGTQGATSFGGAPSFGGGLTFGSNAPSTTQTGFPFNTTQFGSSSSSPGRMTFGSNLPSTTQSGLTFGITPSAQMGTNQPTTNPQMFGINQSTTTTTAPQTGVTFGFNQATTTSQTPGLTFGFNTTTPASIFGSNPSSTAPTTSFGASGQLPSFQFPSSTQSFGNVTSTTGIATPFPQPTTPAGSSFPASNTTASGILFSAPSTSTSQLPASGVSFSVPGSTSQPFMFGVATSATSQPLQFGSTTNVQGTTAATTTQPTAMSFSIPAATTSQSGGLSFNFPNPQNSSFGINATAATTSDSSLSQPNVSTVAATSSAAPISSTSQTTLSLGLPATPQPSISFGTTTTQSIASSVTTSTPSNIFGSVTSGQTSGIFGVKSTSATTTSTSSSIFPTSMTLATTTPSTTASAFKGLGGVSVATTSAENTPAVPASIKDTLLPNEIQQTVKSFKEYLNLQKNTNGEIARLPGISKTDEQFETLQNSLVSLSTAISRQRQAIENVKSSIIKALNHLQIFQKLYYYPPSLEDQNLALRNYFTERILVFEERAKKLEEEITEIYQHIVTLPHTTSISTDDLKLVIQKLHSSFIAISGNHNKVHNEIQLFRVQHSTLRNMYLKDIINKNQPVTSTTTTVKEIINTSSFLNNFSKSSLVSSDGQFSAANMLSLLRGDQTTSSSSTGILNSFLSYQPPLNSSSLNNSNFGSTFSSPPSVLSVQQPQSSNLQLQRPPVGYKRGKR